MTRLLAWAGGIGCCCVGLAIAAMMLGASSSEVSRAKQTSSALQRDFARVVSELPDRMVFDEHVSPVGWKLPWSGSASKSSVIASGYQEAIQGREGDRSRGDSPEWSPLFEGGIGGWIGPSEFDLGGPWREPAASRYRIRSGDLLQFTFQQTRDPFQMAYRLAYGDQLRISSDTHPELNSNEPVEVLPDGTISVPGVQCVPVAGLTLTEARQLLEQQLVEVGKYNNPRITLLPVRVYQRLQDLLNAVDARFGTGGQGIQLTVIRDGTLALPLVGTVSVVGLTKEELREEVNARYAQQVHGIEVTVNIIQTAPSFVYVLGQVAQPGRLEARLPLTAWQAVAQAGGQLPGGQLRHVVVVRRTPDWRLVATRLDLTDANLATPQRFQDLWLWDSDIVIVPKARIQRFDELVDLYLTRGAYALVPSQIQFDSNSVF